MFQILVDLLLKIYMQDTNHKSRFRVSKNLKEAHLWKMMQDNSKWSSKRHKFYSQERILNLMIQGLKSRPLKRK